MKGEALSLGMGGPSSGAPLPIPCLTLPALCHALVVCGPTQMASAHLLWHAKRSPCSGWC